MFDDCKIHTCAQRSDEWFKLRRGVLTASEFAEWLVELPKIRLTISAMKDVLDRAGISYPKGLLHDQLAQILPDRKKYLTMTKGGEEAMRRTACKLLAQSAGCWEPPRFVTEAMRRGTELEPEAVECFEQETGMKVEQVGFCRSLETKAGCSPDGLIMEIGEGFEGKVPLPEVHCQMIIDGWLPDEYKLQVHGSMAITGAEAWWFQSYCPGLPPFRIRVRRDEFTEEIVKGLERFDNLLEVTRKRLENRWDDWRNLRIALEIDLKNPDEYAPEQLPTV